MLWLLWFGIGTTVCSGAVPTFSGSLPKACAQSAQDTLRASHDAAMRVLRRPVSERRSAQLDEIFQRLLDFDALAKRSLATHWETIEVHKRSEFVSLLRQLVERSYRSNLTQTQTYRVAYLGQTTEEEEVRVATTARSAENRRAPPIEIEYRMHQFEGTWKVFDVVTDGVSMVQNYKRQFGRILSRDGIDALLDRMRTRLAEGAES